jgi:hypothetical protein
VSHPAKVTRTANGRSQNLQVPSPAKPAAALTRIRKTSEDRRTQLQDRKHDKLFSAIHHEGEKDASFEAARVYAGSSPLKVPTSHGAADSFTSNYPTPASRDPSLEPEIRNSTDAAEVTAVSLQDLDADTRDGTEMIIQMVKDELAKQETRAADGWGGVWTIPVTDGDDSARYRVRYMGLYVGGMWGWAVKTAKSGGTLAPVVHEHRLK